MTHHVDEFQDGEFDRGPWLEILTKAEVPKDEETLLETAQGLEGEQLDAWLKSLSDEETKELWAQSIVATIDVILPQMIALFGPPKEASDGEVSGNAE